MRDCDLTFVENGKQISTTEYIHKKILVTTNTGNKPPSNRDKVVEAILTMFPNIECQQIPNPGPGISNPAKTIDPDFLAHLNACIQYILSNIKPKQSFSGTNPLNGQMLASLLEQYVHAINEPGGVPNLEASFQSATETTLQHKIIELQQAYFSQMEEHLQRKLPMEVGDVEVLESSHSYLMDEALAGKLQAANDILGEQSNLFQVHLAVYSNLLISLTSEVHRWIPILKEEQETLNKVEHRKQYFLQFQDKIVKTQNSKVSGGIINDYLKHNEDASKEMCTKCFEFLYGKQRQHQMISLEKLRTDYYNHKQVKGPAKDDVFKTRFSHIPGPPQDLCIQTSTDQTLTLLWKKPVINPEVVTSYQVYVHSEGENSRMLPATQNNSLKAVIQNLKPMTQYKIKVQGVNNTNNTEGEISDVITAKTKAGKPDKPEKPSIRIETATKGSLFVDMLPESKQNGSPVTHIIVTQDIILYSNTTETKSLFFPVNPNQRDHQCIPVNIKCGKNERALCFKVQFKNEAGLSEVAKSDRLYQEDMIPGKPGNVQKDLQSLKPREITVNWDSPKINPAAVATYHVEFWEKPAVVQKKSPQPNTKQTDSGHRSMVIQGLTPKTKYIIQVCAKNREHKSSEFSNQIEVETPIDVPNKPRIISIRAISPSNAVISFNKQSPAEENGSTVYAVKVQRFTKNECIWNYLQYRSEHPLACIQGSSEVCEYPLVVSQNNPDIYEVNINLASLTEEVTVSYRIKTINKKGASEPSQQMDLHPNMVIPGKIQSLEANEITCNSIKLCWKKPTMNPIAAKLYEIKYKNVKDSNWLLRQRDSQKDSTSDFISTEISNLKPCTVYEFVVRSQNGNNTSPECLMKVKTRPSVPPTPRTPLLFPNGDKFILKTYLPAIEESGREVENILVCYFDVRGNKVSNKPEDFPINLMSVQEQIDGTRIYEQLLEIDIDQADWISICLKNEVGPSKESEMVGVTTGDVTPGEPDDLRVESGPRQVKLFWKAPKKHGNAAKLYQVFLVEEDDLQQLENLAYKQSFESGGLPSYEMAVSGLTPFKHYKFAVQGVNNVGKEIKVGNQSTISVLTEKAPPEKPLAPNVMVIKDEPLKAELTFTILSKEHINGTSLETAEIEFFSFKWVLVKKIELKSEDLSEQLRADIQLHNLEDETIASYRFRVKMSNECYMSDPSEEFLLPVSQLQPGEPRNLTVSDVTAHTMKVTWEKPDVHPALVKGYFLEWSSKSENTMPKINLPSLDQKCEYDIKNLKSNQEYTIKVNSLASSACLPAVMEVSTQEVYPSAPINLYAERIGSNSVKIRWSKPKVNTNEVIFYHVELREGDYSQKRTSVSPGASLIATHSQVSIPETKQTKQTKGHSTVLRSMKAYTTYTVSVSSHNDNKQRGEGATTSVKFRTKMNPHVRRAFQAAAALPTLGMGAVALGYAQAPNDDILSSDEEFHDQNAFPSAPMITKIKQKKFSKVKIKWDKPGENPDELHNKHPYFLEVREGEWKERLEQIKQSGKDSETAPEPTEIAPRPIQSIWPDLSSTKGKLKCKVKELDPNTTYTFSLFSINYLGLRGGTTHVEYKTLKIKPSKFSKTKLTREQKQSPQETFEMDVFAAPQPEPVDPPLHPLTLSSEHVSCHII